MATLKKQPRKAPSTGQVFRWAQLRGGKDYVFDPLRKPRLTFNPPSSKREESSSVCVGVFVILAMIIPTTLTPLISFYFFWV